MAYIDTEWFESLVQDISVDLNLLVVFLYAL